MKEEQKEKMLNLLADRALFGLGEAELAEFEQLANEFPALSDDNSFELAAAAFSLVDLQASELLPAHLSAKISAQAEKLFTAAENEPEEYQKTFAFKPKRSISSWLGWAVAALACIALLVNIWVTRQPSKDVAGVTPTPAPTVLPKPDPNPAEQREQLLASTGDVIRRNWTDFPKDPHGVTGDVVWSNSQQKGFVHFHNLPVNDKARETYQLWIFDAKQGAKTPVDAGIFDVDQDGDVIIPIDARLKITEPKMFAVTAEKPGGVVVSKLGKVMAIAKVET